MPKYPHVGSKAKNMRIAKFEIEFESVFHMKQLYKMMYEWMRTRGFTSADGIGEPESLYMELVTGSGLQNHHIWWRYERTESQYHKFFIKIDFQTLAMTTVEIMHEGKKRKTNKGDVIIRVEGWLMLDFRQEWGKHWLLKHYDRWFRQRHYKSQIDSYKEDLWYTIYDFHDDIKDYMDIATSYDKPRPYVNKKGLV